MGSLEFHGTHKNIFTIKLNHSSYWHSADVNIMYNDLVHVMPWQCMFVLSVCLLKSMILHKLRKKE